MKDYNALKEFVAKKEQQLLGCSMRYLGQITYELKWGVTERSLDKLLSSSNGSVTSVLAKDFKAKCPKGKRKYIPRTKRHLLDTAELEKKIGKAIVEKYTEGNYYVQNDNFSEICLDLIRKHNVTEGYEKNLKEIKKVRNNYKETLLSLKEEMEEAAEDILTGTCEDPVKRYADIAKSYKEIRKYNEDDKET